MIITLRWGFGSAVVQDDHGSAIYIMGTGVRERKVRGHLRHICRLHIATHHVDLNDEHSSYHPPLSVLNIYPFSFHLLCPSPSSLAL